jgi:hypothetical protein
VRSALQRRGSTIHRGWRRRRPRAIRPRSTHRSFGWDAARAPSATDVRAATAAAGDWSALSSSCRGDGLSRARPAHAKTGRLCRRGPRWAADGAGPLAAAPSAGHARYMDHSRPGRGSSGPCALCAWLCLLSPDSLTRGCRQLSPHATATHSPLSARVCDRFRNMCSPGRGQGCSLGRGVDLFRPPRSTASIHAGAVRRTGGPLRAATVGWSVRSIAGAAGALIWCGRNGHWREAMRRIRRTPPNGRRHADVASSPPDQQRCVGGIVPSDISMS